MNPEEDFLFFNSGAVQAPSLVRSCMLAINSTFGQEKAG